MPEPIETDRSNQVPIFRNGVLLVGTISLEILLLAQQYGRTGRVCVFVREGMCSKNNVIEKGCNVGDSVWQNKIQNRAYITTSACFITIYLLSYDRTTETTCKDSSIHQQYAVQFVLAASPYPLL